MKKYLLALIATLILTGCGALHTAGLMGAPVGAENSDYKVSGAGGVIASIVPKSIEDSTYRYGFAIDLKNAQSVAAVRIERQNKDRTRTLIIDDSNNKTKAGQWQKQQPAGAQSYLSGKGLGNVSWVGQSPSFNMTKEQAPWLYKSGNTREVYLITITDLNGKKTTLKQHTTIPNNAKQTYWQLLK